MLSPHDDLPVHQTAEPVAHLVSGDPGAFERYGFTGHDEVGEVAFAVELTLHPNRGIVDGALTIVRDGLQRSAHASARLVPGDRPTAVGPLRVEVVEPLRTLRVVLDDDGSLGLAADLTFNARTVAVETPRHTVRRDGRLLLDTTRAVQWGDWSGSLTVDGAVVALTPDTHPGVRTRSWGVASWDGPTPGAPRHDLPQALWLWAPLRVGGRALLAGLHEHADGRRAFVAAASVPLLDPVPPGPLVATEGTPGATGDDATEVDRSVTTFRDVTCSVDWQGGTRRAAGARLRFVPARGDDLTVELTPLATMAWRGLGHVGPDWPSGAWKDELAVGSAAWPVAALDPTDVHHLGLRQIVRVRLGDAVGTGVLDQFALGPHEPSGLTGFTDGFEPSSANAPADARADEGR